MLEEAGEVLELHNTPLDQVGQVVEVMEELVGIKEFLEQPTQAVVGAEALQILVIEVAQEALES
jgi:hypothetical protein